MTAGVGLGPIAVIDPWKVVEHLHLADQRNVGVAITYRNSSVWTRKDQVYKSPSNAVNMTPRAGDLDEASRSHRADF